MSDKIAVETLVESITDVASKMRIIGHSPPSMPDILKKELSYLADVLDSSAQIAGIVNMRFHTQRELIEALSAEPTSSLFMRVRELETKYKEAQERVAELEKSQSTQKIETSITEKTSSKHEEFSREEYEGRIDKLEDALEYYSGLIKEGET